MKIRTYKIEDQDQLVLLWQTVFPDEPPHNEPRQVIDSKLAVDELIFVAITRQTLVGAVMAGYDGHRGWLYAVAVAPSQRRCGTGRQLVEHALKALKRAGCIKVNLQIRSTNATIVAFYESLGFRIEDRISMGMHLTNP